MAVRGILRFLVCITVVLSLGLTTGCTDPAYRSKKTFRRDGVAKSWGMLSGQQRRGGHDLQELQAVSASHSAKQAEKLKVTREMINKRIEADAQNWKDEETARKEATRKQLKGRSKSAKDAWRDMTY